VLGVHISAEALEVLLFDKFNQLWGFHRLDIMVPSLKEQSGTFSREMAYVLME
jgi:hypothetical protein